MGKCICGHLEARHTDAVWLDRRCLARNCSCMKYEDRELATVEYVKDIGYSPLSEVERLAGEIADLQAEVERLKELYREAESKEEQLLEHGNALQRRHDALREAARPFVDPNYSKESGGNVTVIVHGREFRSLRAATEGENDG